MARAIRSENLQERARDNQRFGRADFDGWVNGLMNSLKFRSVLDVCCGTGNQLVKYADIPSVEKIIGIDLSEESLDRAQDRLEECQDNMDIALIPVGMEEMFGEPSLANQTFDLISCFYGLYYARNVEAIMAQMCDHLSKNGSILIVGPYGKNNASFFGLLRRHFGLPELVVRSATTFMEEEVLTFLSQRANVTTQTFVNPICFPESQPLLDYWKASTFYAAEHESAVEQDIVEHFEKHGQFVIEKHVMAIKAGKK